MDNSIGVYIHIPFCKAKCYYCDFNSYSGREYLAGSYFDALKEEIVSRSASIRGRRVSSVFIGGGTPSLVDPAYIGSVLEVCSKELDIADDAEVSMESNPGTLDYEKLRRYRKMGINRLSIGLQAWQDSLLKSIGRIHDRRQFIDNFNAAVEAGFDNINVDLIFGLPGQTSEEWAETLEAVTAAGGRSLKHLSCYSLKIEEGTVLGDRLEAGTLVPADDDLDRQMYHYAVEYLAKKGFRHYEISNFACPGYECRHNLIYWKAREYAGFGAGAHSYIDSVRFNNVTGIEQYITAAEGMANKTGSSRTGCAAGRAGSASCRTGDSGCADDVEDTNSGPTDELFEDKQYIDRNDAMAEFMILGLRLTDGLSPTEFKERFGEDMEGIYGDKLDKLIRKGLVSAERNNAGNDSTVYKLTKLGLDLANIAFVEFI
jgi:oxygen-independent coproporphyrinogen-3 oxidase